MEENQNRYRESARAFAEACRVLPGGVNSPVRAFGGVDMGPVFVACAKGSKIFDIDGNEYIDYVGSWGPMILGHAHPSVIGAVEAAARKGTSFGARRWPKRRWRRKSSRPSIRSRRFVFSAAVPRRS